MALTPIVFTVHLYSLSLIKPFSFIFLLLLHHCPSLLSDSRTSHSQTTINEAQKQFMLYFPLSYAYDMCLYILHQFSFVVRRNGRHIYVFSSWSFFTNKEKHSHEKKIIPLSKKLIFCVIKQY
eukprot:GDKJ01040929.1.p1 GENE.GDKJ01040929.1~~GDKJ01040929.1.p1  ORF type:complete len:123 (-),score=11.97 GDKJ01040929.1:1577-1945(-)